MKTWREEAQAGVQVPTLRATVGDIYGTDGPHNADGANEEAGS